MVWINRNHLSLYALFILFLVLNIGLWTKTHTLRPAWGNVPPVTSEPGAAMMALGDRQLAYRMIAMMLQNLGNTGGDSTPLKNYNYNMLQGWFFLEDKLDPVADFIPNLAAFYFGATQTPKEQLGPVIDYLEIAGQRPGKDKWRWLAQAVYLARYKKEDLGRALQLANILSNLNQPDLPLWAKSMPAFVMRAKGDKQAAYEIMMNILSSGVRTLSPIEIRFLRDNICDQTLTPAQAAQNELCTKTK